MTPETLEPSNSGQAGGTGQGSGQTASGQGSGQTAGTGQGSGQAAASGQENGQAAASGQGNGQASSQDASKTDSAKEREQTESGHSQAQRRQKLLPMIPHFRQPGAEGKLMTRLCLLPATRCIPWRMGRHCTESALSCIIICSI